MLWVSSKKKLCTKSSISASLIGNNSNLLVDILYRLPAKSLCVFKIVSKQWLSSISDPCFERNYSLRSRHLSVPALFIKKPLRRKGRMIGLVECKVLVMNERTDINYAPFHTPIDVNYFARINFEQYCNGLVLCKVQDGDHNASYYVIYNPSTEHCRTLPSPSLKENRVPSVWSATIAFDPAKSSYYEVVCVCNTVNTVNMHQIEIYSSKTGSWRAVGDPFPLSSPGMFLSPPMYSSGVYWNGSVHWMDKWTATLQYIDIDYGLMKTIRMPTKPYPAGEYNRQIVYFRECRGHVHLMEMRDRDMSHFDIWEMRTDYTGWNAKYYVDLTPLTTPYPNTRFHYHGFYLDVLLIEEVEDSSRLILRIRKNKVISFDLKDKSFTEMCDVNPDVLGDGFEHMETLTRA